MENGFIEKHAIKEFTVFTDAAMISTTNMQELLRNSINYIVGARLGNLSGEQIKQIDRSMIREDGKTIRIKTDHGYMFCYYSTVWYRKDKHEMEKQIEKAGSIIESASKIKKAKFIETTSEQVVLNHALIEKSQKLLGIKGVLYQSGRNHREQSNHHPALSRAIQDRTGLQDI